MSRREILPEDRFQDINQPGDISGEHPLKVVACINRVGRGEHGCLWGQGFGVNDQKETPHHAILVLF